MDFVPMHDQGSGVVQYLKRDAFPDEIAKKMRTYLVKDVDTEELVGFFSLKAGLVSLNERVFDGIVKFDTLPGIELALFAVNKKYAESHAQLHGIGETIFVSMILPLVKQAQETIGITTLYIFSLPQKRLIKNYSKYGFQMLPEEQAKLLHKRLKPVFDRSCIFMHMPI